jgi:hypothetical protein
LGDAVESGKLSIQDLQQTHLHDQNKHSDCAEYGEPPSAGLMEISLKPFAFFIGRTKKVPDSFTKEPAVTGSILLNL